MQPIASRVVIIIWKGPTTLKYDIKRRIRLSLLITKSQHVQMEMRIIFQSSLLFSFTFEKTKLFRKISWKLGAGWMTCSIALVYLTAGSRLIRRLGRETAAVSYSSFTRRLVFCWSYKKGGGLGQQVIAAAVDPLILFFFSCPFGNFVFRRENKYLSQFITRHTVNYYYQQRLSEGP